MKITQLREKDGNLTLSTTDLDTFLQKIKTETKTQPVSTFRQQLRYCLPGKRCNEADRLPKVLPAAEFRKTNGVCQMKTYNGIVELTVGPLSGKSEIALVKRLAWEQPQTRLVFTGSSGRTVKIWTTFTRPNNSLPGKREEAEVFHAHAYRLAVKCYQPQLPFDILLKEPKLEQYSRLSFDPEAMYRPDSIQFYLAQPVSMPDETTYREALQDEKSPLTRAVLGYEAEEAIIMLFEAALQKTFAEATGAGADNSLHSLTVRLAENCFRSGIPEEETVKRTYFHYYLRQKETVIRQIVRSVYLLQPHPGIQSAGRLSVRPSALGRERPYPGTRPDSTLQQPVLGRTVPPLVSQHGGTLARQYRQEICQQRLPLIGRCTRHPQKHLLPKHRPARAACLLYGQHRLLAQARRRTLPQPFCAHQHR